MEENQLPEETRKQEQKQPNVLAEFFLNIVRGAAIGVAFIIPGFSGGSVAAILGIYEKLVGSVADIFKHFKSSIAFLFPILIGLVLGVAALILPIQWGLNHFPIPTVSLFVGLALGGLPSVTEKVKGKPNWTHILACLIPLVFAASLCFLPTAEEKDLLHLEFGGYLLLVLIGAVGACALVVPGISGSMLLLIFGYYTPLVDLLTKHLLMGQDIGVSILVFFCVGIGVIAGFFGISILMKHLLKRFPRGTYFAIIGFIVGSIPAVYASVIGEPTFDMAMLKDPWYIVVSVALLLVGAALSLALVLYARKKGKRKAER